MFVYGLFYWLDGKIIKCDRVLSLRSPQSFLKGLLITSPKGQVNMTIQSLSDLDKSDREAYANETSQYLQENIGQYLEEYYSSLVTFYIESTNTAQKRGYVLISVRQFDELDDKEFNDDHVDTCLFWQKKFIPFESVSNIDCDADLFFSQIKKTDPYQMPVVFFDSRKYVPFKGKTFKADCLLTIQHVFFLSSHAEDVVKDQKDRVKKEQVQRQQPERKLEDQLYDWLRLKDVNVERQVVTAKHRLDLWLPNKAMLELKQGRVSGDDVCQAIDYAASYQMPIVLVGTGLSNAASRGIDGFNRAMGEDLIIFVTWGGIRAYLNGLLQD